jgi:hypothetical protein|tara:strand:- start:164 stop:400 length:237 start_codon:yes stop_codon:yes gene_type:complete
MKNFDEEEFEKLCLKAWEETKERIKDSAPEDFKRLNKMSYKLFKQGLWHGWNSGSRSVVNQLIKEGVLKLPKEVEIFQ